MYISKGKLRERRKKTAGSDTLKIVPRHKGEWTAAGDGVAGGVALSGVSATFYLCHLLIPVYIRVQKHDGSCKRFNYYHFIFIFF